MSWRLVDDQWCNFSKFRSLYIQKIRAHDQYVIFVETDDGEQEDYELFSSVFNTRSDAEIFLNKFMSKDET